MRRRTGLVLGAMVTCLAVGVGGYGAMRVFANGSAGCGKSGIAHE
jgi:hypothetical protein